MSRSFEILCADEPTERARWLSLWSSSGGREVSAHPDYVRLFARPQDVPFCVAQRGDNGGILLPLIRRPLAVEPWVGGEGDDNDITSPYGYGGAYRWGAVDEVGFWSDFEIWASDIGAVSLFVRLSLFPDRQAHFPWETQFRMRNVVRSLQISPEEMWMDFEHKVRKNVKKARRKGLQLEVDPEARKLEAFLRIYYGTMERVGAEAEYYFSRSFFESLLSDLSSETLLFHAMKDGTVASSELVLISRHTLYSFLGGTLKEFFQTRANDFLKYSIMEWGQANGKQAYVLGGGQEDGDGIFRYKRSFAPDGVVPFYTGSKVFRPERYRELIGTRRRWAERHGEAWEPSESFFPAYRS